MSTARRERRLKPLQQGELDGLCGLYAIINAIRWVVPHTDFSRDDVDLLFALLIEEAGRAAGGMAAVADGIPDAPFRDLARAAGRHLRDQFGIRVRVHCPFSRLPQPSIRVVLAHMRSRSRDSATAFVVGLRGRYLHWTVFVGVTRHHAILFDSAAIRRLRLACCRMQHQTRGRKLTITEHELCAATILAFERVSR